MMRIVSLLIAAAALTGCNDGAMRLQGEQMEQVLLQCKEDLGYQGATQTVVEFDGATLSARVEPYDQIDAAAAAQINACASGSSVLGDGMVVVPIDAVDPQSSLPAAVDPAPYVPATTNGCPPGVKGLYRGTLFCRGDL